MGDILSFYNQRAPGDMPTIDVASMMDENDIRNIPVIDKAGRFLGM